MQPSAFVAGQSFEGAESALAKSRVEKGDLDPKRRTHDIGRFARS
jgi:hypothetical protein